MLQLYNLSKMLLKITLFGFLVLCQTLIKADNNVPSEHQEENQYRPYRFSFQSGRFPGNIDRTRAEFGDANGVVRGLYTYIDPKQQMRSVEYTADEDGFHPKLNIPPAIDKPAVAAAKSRHYELFDEIASSDGSYHPADTSTVAKAKENHLLLFKHIAKQHAKLAAEQEARRKKEEEKLLTSIEH